MRRSWMTALTIIVVALATLLVAACSSDSDSEDGHDDTVAAADADHDEATHDDADHDDAHQDQDLWDQEVVQSISLDMIDVAYAPAEITVEAGELVELVLTNSGAADHDFTIEEIHAAHAYHEPHEEVAGHADHGDEFAMHHALTSGDAVTMRFIAEEHGTYQFYCTVPGHKEAGMVGTLVVEG